MRNMRLHAVATCGTALGAHAALAPLEQVAQEVHITLSSWQLGHHWLRTNEHARLGQAASRPGVTHWQVMWAAGLVVLAAGGGWCRAAAPLQADTEQLSHTAAGSLWRAAGCLITCNILRWIGARCRAWAWCWAWWLWLRLWVGGLLGWVGGSHCDTTHALTLLDTSPHQDVALGTPLCKHKST